MRFAARFPMAFASLLLMLTGAGRVEAQGGTGTETGAGPRDLYVDYSERPNAEALLASKLSILQPHAGIDLAAIHQAGGKVLGYLSLAEIAESSRDHEAALATGVPVLGFNPAWRSKVMDVSDPRWRDFIVEKMARTIADQGWDGFFLDTADSVALVDEAHRARVPELRQGLVRIVKALRETWPEKRLVINRGFELLDELGKAVDGVMIESVFQSHDPKRGYVAVEAETTRLLLARIEALHESGRAVYVLDYVDPLKPALISETEARIRGIGAIPFVSVPALDGGPRAGFVPVPRKVLVLYGHDPAEAEKPPMFGEDTASAAMLQMPLEHQGYEVAFHNVGDGLPPELNPADYAGVVFDEEIELPYRLERPLLAWLGTTMDAGLKVFFLGGYAFDDPGVREQLFKRLGLRGGDLDGWPLGKASFVTLEPGVADFEAKLVPTNREFQNLRAPEDARVIVGLAVGAEGDPYPARYDPAYTCSWGGALLAPYVTSQLTEEIRLHFVDPFALLGRVWPAGTFPAPDVTTREGLRIYFSHVDGDGFSSLSSVSPGKTCGEIMESEILKDMRLPISISVIEAEMRGHMITQKEGAAETLQAIARRILALPQVEPASHSYSHPYIWRDDDGDYGHSYDRRNLELKPTTGYAKVDAQREVGDSLDFVTRELCPPGKPAKLMLWSGNCRPSEAAILSAERAGATHMNGGNTILSRRFPGLISVAPKLTWWGDVMQVYAPNQNEFYYTGGWEGDFHWGFAQVIETFEQTAAPRRLKPVNVYYHFYSVEHPDALEALKTIYAWCAKQPLHAMWTSDYSELVKDSFHTRVFRREGEPGAFLIQNEGRARTFRLPVGAGWPDLARCRGVSGWNVEGDQLYVHATGAKEVELFLAPEATVPARPHLRSSTAPLTWNEKDSTERAAAFTLGGFPARVVLAGFVPGEVCHLLLDREAREITIAGDGTAALELPAGAVVSVSRSDLSLSRR